jgi:thermostable 8-oxoguanine DNA glycosylase
MVNPDQITKFFQTVPELEEVLLFWIAVAGKTAVVIAQRIDQVLQELGKRFPGASTPFEKVRAIPEAELVELLRARGIGCYKQKARSMKLVASSGLDLTTCSVDELDAIYGIGPKTARCFVMHSRPDVRHAGLDTHVMKYLHKYGCVPKSLMPKDEVNYCEIEKVFLKIADIVKMTPAKLDLVIWRQYRRDLGPKLRNPDLASCG